MAEKLIRCSFCGKTQAQVKRIMSGPNAYICNECVELCSTILHEEMYETGSSELAVPDHLPTPKEIKEYMDGYIIGQDEAKIALSVAVYNHRSDEAKIALSASRSRPAKSSASVKSSPLCHGQDREHCAGYGTRQLHGSRQKPMADVPSEKDEEIGCQGVRGDVMLSLGMTKVSSNAHQA